MEVCAVSPVGHFLYKEPEDMIMFFKLVALKHGIWLMEEEHIMERISVWMGKRQVVHRWAWEERPARTIDEKCAVFPQRQGWQGQWRSQVGWWSMRTQPLMLVFCSESIVILVFYSGVHPCCERWLEEGCVGCIIVRHAKYDGVGCQHCEWEGGCRKESTGLREQTGPVYFITFAVLLSTTSTGTCE